MFGVIVSGRPVQTNAQQVGETNFLMDLGECGEIVHLVVFLIQELPAGFGVTVHLSWPSLPDWKLLGFLSNQKPSAIFKISDSRPPAPPFTPKIGFALEPLTTIETNIVPFLQRPANNQIGQYGISQSVSMDDGMMDPARPLSKEGSLAVARKLLGHFQNYVLSFGANETVTRIMKGWYESVERKINNDPEFFTRVDV